MAPKVFSPNWEKTPFLKCPSHLIGDGMILAFFFRSTIHLPPPFHE
jgi:hypothetical protein